MFLAYFFNNLFVFDNLISLILFATFLAYVSFRSKIGVNALIVKEAPKTDYGKAVYAVIIGVAFAFIIYIVNIPGILTSKTIINAFKMAGTGNAQGAFDLFQKAIAYNSFGSMEAREHLSSFAMQVYGNPNLDKEFKDKVANYTIDELKSRTSNIRTISEK